MIKKTRHILLSVVTLALLVGLFPPTIFANETTDHQKGILLNEYDGIWSFSDGMAKVKVKEKYGFIDRTGALIVEAKYDDVGYFQSGIAYVEKDDKYGFIDKTGNEFVKPQYTIPYLGDIPSFKEGLALIHKDGKYGFINRAGREITKLKYESANYFKDGVATVKRDGKWGMIDKTGKEITKLQYLKIEMGFQEGLAVAKKQEGNKVVTVYIDKTGKEVLKVPYKYAYGFTEGMAPVVDDGLVYIDRTGKAVIKLQYDSYYTKTFQDGVVFVREDTGYDNNGKWGLVDKAGKVLVKPKYDDVEPFIEGMAKVKKDGKMGYINNKGKKL